MEITSSIELTSIAYSGVGTKTKSKERRKIVKGISKVFPFFDTVCLFRGVLYVLLIAFLIRIFVFSTLEFLFNFGNLGRYRLYTCIRGPSSGHSINSLAFMCSPIFGILADRYISRHRIISFGLFTLFIASIAFTLLFLTAHHKTSEMDCRNVVIGFSFILFFYVIGFAAILPLLLPFGVDQMEGANEQSLKSYFTWFYWALNAGAFVSYGYYVGFTDFQGVNLYKIDIMNDVNIVAILLTGLLGGTVALFICIVIYKFLIDSQRLQTYYPSGDPLGLIWNVTKQALRNYSHKKRRNSIVRSVQYLEGSQRLLDFAKDNINSTYEHVESVKTFYRIMPLLLALIPYFAVINISTGAYIEQNIYLFAQFEDATIIPQLIDPLIILILVLVFEFNPVKKRVKFSNILQRVYTGVVFALASLACATIVEFVSTYVKPFELFQNSTIVTQPIDRVRVLAYKILFQSPQFLLMGISEFLAGIGAFEFIYAQSPREMKCFIYGLFQCIRGIGFIIPFVLNEILQTSTCSCDTCTCGSCAAYHYQCGRTPTNVAFTYLVGCILFGVYVVALGFLFRNYKRRERQPREVWYT